MLTDHNRIRVKRGSRECAALSASGMSMEDLIKVAMMLEAKLKDSTYIESNSSSANDYANSIVSKYGSDRAKLSRALNQINKAIVVKNAKEHPPTEHARDIYRNINGL